VAYLNFKKRPIFVGSKALAVVQTTSEKGPPKRQALGVDNSLADKFVFTQPLGGFAARLRTAAG